MKGARVVGFVLSGVPGSYLALAANTSGYLLISNRPTAWLGQYHAGGVWTALPSLLAPSDGVLFTVAGGGDRFAVARHTANQLDLYTFEPAAGFLPHHQVSGGALLALGFAGVHFSALWSSPAPGYAWHSQVTLSSRF
jgi:hypothetical protein